MPIAIRSCGRAGAELRFQQERVVIVSVVPVFAQGGHPGYQGRVASGNPGAGGERRPGGRCGRARMCHGCCSGHWHRATGTTTVHREEPVQQAVVAQLAVCSVSSRMKQNGQRPAWIQVTG
jgi:hypothetical protein